MAFPIMAAAPALEALKTVVLTKAVELVTEWATNDERIDQARFASVAWLRKKAADTKNPIDDRFVEVYSRFIGIKG